MPESALQEDPVCNEIKDFGKTDESRSDAGAKHAGTTGTSAKLFQDSEKARFTMSGETRKCPKCGNECKSYDVFCNKCGERLPEENPKCPVCGKEYKAGEDVFCNKCGTKLPQGDSNGKKRRICPICDTEYEETDKVCKMCGADLTLINPGPVKPAKKTVSEEFAVKEKQPSMVGLLIGVFCVVLFGAMFLLHSFAPDSSVKIPKNMTSDDITDERSAKPCDDEDVKERLLEEFKENHPFFNDIASSSINYLSVKTPVTVEFESSKNRYLCTAQIVAESLKGFRPSEYNENNKFFNFVQTDVTDDDGVKQIKNALKIKCDVKYSSEISAGRTTVRSSGCGGGTSWSIGGEEIIWDRYKEYVEIPGEREKVLKEKEEEEKRLENERLEAEKKAKEEEERRIQEEERKAQEALRKEQEAVKKAREEELKRLEAERKRLEEWQRKQEELSKQTDEVFKTIMPAGHEE